MRYFSCTLFALGSRIIAQQSDMIKIYKSLSPPAAWLVAVFHTPVELTEHTRKHTTMSVSVSWAAHASVWCL